MQSAQAQLRLSTAACTSDGADADAWHDPTFRKGFAGSSSSILDNGEAPGDRVLHDGGSPWTTTGVT
jgi:hypothetical protein